MSKANPLNDDDYDGNDAQIEDLKDLVRGLAGALQQIADDPDACSCDAAGWYGDGHATLCPQSVTREALKDVKEPA